jgi:hypothetical protein
MKHFVESLRGSCGRVGSYREVDTMRMKDAILILACKRYLEVFVLGVKLAPRDQAMDGAYICRPLRR